MAEDKNDGSNNDESGEDGEGGGKKKPPLMIIIAGLLVVVLGGGAAAYFMGLFGGSGGGEQAGIEKKDSIYYDIPELVVNLASGRERAQYLKLKVAVEASSQDNIDALQPKLPRIQDMFQIYLREMRRSDLEGSAGVYRLKQELMRRINITIHPAKIERVLFKEIIIQ